MTQARLPCSINASSVSNACQFRLMRLHTIPAICSELIEKVSLLLLQAVLGFIPLLPFVSITQLLFYFYVPGFF